MIDREEKIRQRAHEIWESEGRPEGRGEDHWLQACLEIDNVGHHAAGEGETPTVAEVPSAKPRRVA